MQLLAFKETTQWASPNVRNHTYLLDGNKLYAYIKEGTTEQIWYPKPIKNFDKRGRTFTQLKRNPFHIRNRILSVSQLDGARGAVIVEVHQ
jgi:hypothetical protein